MNRILAFLAIFIGSTSTALAQKNLEDLEGRKPYTPSKLEWLAVEMNSENRIELSEANPFSLTFIPLEDQDTLLIYVRYLPTANRESMNISIDSAREVIGIRAKSLGWNHWLNIEEDVQMVKKAESDTP